MNQTLTTNWSGGVSPFGIGHKKLGMWLFILSDSLTFGVLLMCYGYVRVASEAWAKPFTFSPSIIFSTVMTLCLLTSSLTMVMAVTASAQGDRSKLVKWILATIAAGLAFVVLHLIEWNHLIAEGLRPFSVPAEWGATASPMFGATFFAITGLHMLHVLSGVIYLGVTAARKRATHEDVEICGLYWHFVDLVWMFVFPLIYLLSIKY
ncbi:MAG TPA: cytochrome c oxidase subunit 3 [Blastocatellia bacterium]|nr:cytochrome c oxidase subunit 3 [Blastocatellia bacterium]